MSGGTSSALGPGKYAAPLVVPVNQTLRLSYAPFASSAERGMLVQETDHTPGPGEYSAGAHHPGKPLGPAVSGPFVSAVARFRDDPRTAVPGPGHYRGVDLSWAKREPKGRRRDGVPDASRKGGVEWVRSATAPPSIPAPAQSFGYEENEAGELVLQRPSHLSGHTGRANDVVGPGECLSSMHEHPFAMERKRGFVEWSKSKTHREMNIKPTGVGQPGPGSFFTESDSASTVRGGGRGSRAGKKVSAFFASTAPRLRTSENLGGARKDPVPGPGSYSAHSDFDRLASTFVPEALQFFGSRTGRMQGPDSHYAKHGSNPTPGPGSYPVKSSIKSGAPDARGATDPYVTPASFASSAPRFEPDRFADLPGPGAFLDQTNTSLELSKKIFGRNTSFGTTEQRFTLSHANGSRVTASSRSDSIGPGVYETNRSSLRPGKKPLSVFVSATKRFDAASGRRAEEEQRAVALGAQEGAESFMRAPVRGIGSEPSYGNAARNNPSAAFAAAMPRFDDRSRIKAMASSPSVGPGSYQSNAGANLYRRAPAVSSSFKTTQRDQGPNNVYAQLGGATESPGPGTYTKDVSRTPSSFIKKSFNITIATEV